MPTPTRPPCPCHPAGDACAPLDGGLSRRRLLLGAAGAAVAVAGAWRVGASVSAQSALPIESSASVTKPAKRLGVATTTTATTTTTTPPTTIPSGGLLFPMASAPKCDVLDNFGESRGGRSHQGIDILATEGQDVYAVADGKLTIQYVDGDDDAILSGNAWTLTLPDGGYFFYAHLASFAPGLSVGSTVRRGDVIGTVGDTGNPGDGNYHLHFEVHPASNGRRAVDPLPLLAIPDACNVY